MTKQELPKDVGPRASFFGPSSDQNGPMLEFLPDSPIDYGNLGGRGDLSASGSEPAPAHTDTKEIEP